jgi:hypothetical protein
VLAVPALRVLLLSISDASSSNHDLALFHVLDYLSLLFCTHSALFNLRLWSFRWGLDAKFLKIFQAFMPVLIHQWILAALTKYRSFLSVVRRKQSPMLAFLVMVRLNLKLKKKNLLIEAGNLLLVLCSNFLNLKLIIFLCSFGLLGHFVILGFIELDEETLKNIVLLFKPEFRILKLIDLLNQLLIFLLVLFNDTFSSLECDLVVMKLLFQS